MWSEFGGKIDSEVWKASIMLSVSASLVTGITSPNISVCIYAFCAENHCLGKKHVWLMLQHKYNCTNHSILQCLMCENMSVIWLQKHFSQVIFLFMDKISSFCPPNIGVNVFANKAVCSYYMLTIFSKIACSIITHQCFFFIQQGHSAHT